MELVIIDNEGTRWDCTLAMENIRMSKPEDVAEVIKDIEFTLAQIKKHVP